MSCLKGQAVHSVYIQSADHKPYFLRAGGKISRSSAGGYAVVAGLPPGFYELGIGFSPDSGADIRFACTVQDKDQSFLLRAVEQGWELFNIHNGAVIRSGDHPAGEPIFKDDGFVNVLAEVVETPSLKTLNPDARRSFEKLQAASGIILGALPYDSFRCVNPAREREFRVLRRKLGRQKNEADKIRLARGLMHEKCFSALQIKYLAQSISAESLRFRFVEMAYDFVYDPGHYGLLKELFSDPVFLNRFADN